MLKLPARLENLGQFMDYVRNFAGDKHIDKGVVHKLELVLEEALVNIMSYAYPDKDGDIDLVCELTAENSVIIRICDTGLAFDMLTREDPDIEAPVEDRPVGGLGIYLIKQMVDEIEYKREDDKNILVLKMRTGGHLC